MKMMKLGAGVVACIALTACSSLSTKPMPESCYSLNALNAYQRAVLDVGTGNPVFQAGGERFVCACYEDSELAMQDESERLAGAGEDGKLIGAGEGGNIAGGDEGLQMTGAGESDRLTGADESGRVAGADEGARLAGADEEGHLVGGSEDTSVAGNFEDARLHGELAKLSCSIVPECSGFKLNGYHPTEINVLTASGTKLTPTSCVTW